MTQDEKMKAVVSITIENEFVVHDIKVIEGEKGLFIAMPSRKASDGEYRDIAHPISSETRTRLQELILEKYKEKLGAVLIVWQGGMEAGNGVADLLCGAVTPSGRLTDTIARNYEDYPSASSFGGKYYNEYKEDIYVGYRDYATRKVEVAYPFGYGLSYTLFEYSNLCITNKFRQRGKMK